MNGGGDFYCFLYENDIDEPEILLYFHDCYDNPQIIGKDFDEFLYINMLSAVDEVTTIILYHNFFNLSRVF